MKKYVVQWGFALSRMAVGLSITIGLAGTSPAQPVESPGAVNHGEATPYHKFLGPWRVIGPIDAGLSDQGERMKQPYLGLEEAENIPDEVTSGSEVFSSVTVPPGLVNVGLAFDRVKEFRNSVAYAETVILSPEEREVVLAIGGDDGIMAWLNGEKVLENVRPNGVYVDDKTSTVTLKSGINRLLVKCDNISEDWGFAARILPTDQTHAMRLLHHLKPMPISLGNLPEAEVTFLDSNGAELDKQQVSAWKFRETPTRAAYIVYPQVDQQPAKVHVEVPVPGANRTFSADFDWADAKDQPIGEPGNLSVRGRVVDAKTSSPLSNATLSLTNMATSQVVTAKDGSFEVKAIDPANGRLFVNAAGHLEAIAQIDARQDEPITVPLETGGVELVGVIKDEDDNPISGATISFHAGGRQRSAKSDAQGRYSVSGLKTTSKSGENVYPVISHPDYQPIGSFSQLVAAEGTTHKDFTLKKGLVATGTVTTPDGKPLAGVTVTSGEDDFASNAANPTTETKADGTYRLGGLAAGARHIFAFHDDWAPAMQTVTLAGKDDTKVDFKLGPGKPVSGRIVDSEGKGIYKATVATDTWRGTRMFHRRAQSDEQGNFTLPHMPLDEVECDFFNTGHSSNRDIKLKGGDTGVSVTLQLPASVSGIVLDDDTGKPLTSFTLVKGYDWKNSSSQSYWNEPTRMSPSDGKFSFKETELTNYNRLFRIEAPGYKMWQYPGSVKAGDRLEDIEVRLEKAKLRPAKIIAPNGDPVPGAKVHLFSAERTLWLGQSKSQSRAKVFTTDDSGMVNMPEEDMKTYGVFAEKEGVGSILLDSIEPSPALISITLEPYGIVTGAAFDGDEPLTDQAIVLIRGSSQKLQVHYEVATGEDGRFRFENIPSGEYTLAIARRNGNRTSYDRQQKIQVPPGMTGPYILGGTGGAVLHGKITTEDGTPLPGLSVSLRWPNSRYASSETDATGHYEFKDVPPGDVTLAARSIMTRANQESYYGSEEITVPEAAEFTEDMVIIVRKPIAPGLILKDVSGVDAKGTTVTLNDQSAARVLLLISRKADTELEEMLTSVSEQLQPAATQKIPLIALLLNTPESDELKKLSDKLPQLTLVSPSSDWISDYYKRYSLPADAVGVVVKPSGEVISIIETIADVKEISGEDR